MLTEATAWNGARAPDVVWCCAGSAHPTLFKDTPLDVLPAQVETNYLSSAYMAHAALNAWLPTPAPGASGAAAQDAKSGGHDGGDGPGAGGGKGSDPGGPARHLIFTSSIVALFPVAGYAPYAPSKAALRSLADSLAREVALYASTHAPVQLHAIFPGTIHTAGYEAENRVKSDLTRMLEEDDAGQSADEAAAASVAGLESGWEMVSTTWLTRAVLGSVWGQSGRCGWGVLDAALATFMGLVSVGVRWDMDRKARAWGRKYGVDGMKR